MSSGPKERFFTVQEVDALLPEVESIMRDIDGCMIRKRELSELLEDMEAYWGEEVADPTNPEHKEHVLLQTGLAGVDQSINTAIASIHELGGHLKSYEQGLVDFYSMQEGRPVFLCWQRGEERVKFYHELDTGFSGRKPIPRQGQ